jgi:choice-of-anchor A domain-containing protein
MKIHKFVPKSLIALVAALGLTSPAAHAAFVDLGEASGYAAFILPGGSINMTINGGAAVDGDVAASAGTHIDLGATAKVGTTAGTDQKVDGKIYLDTISDPQNPATVKLDGQDPNSVVSRNLTQAVHDAIAANQFAAGLAPTQTFSNGLDIKSQFTITGNGGLNVISLSDITLHSDGLLTLQGSASDYFVFNITGTYTQSGKSSVQLSGGLTASNVLWNFIGSGNGANIGTGMNGVAYGTFLAPDRDFSITDTILYGSIITQGHLAIGSQALVVAVPEVTAMWIWPGFLGLVCAVEVHRRRRKAAKVLAA